LFVSAVATAEGLPTRLGKYEILSSLASGGMARIYIARMTGIGAFERHVVIKMILPERAHDYTSVQMFLDEARLAASLNHQNVAQVFEVGQEEGVHYLAMEYVHGQDLRALLAKAGSEGTRVPLELALTVVSGAAAGLHHAHDRRSHDGVPMGIVHRDVSPSNIMIGYDGAVKLLDFGIAKATMRSIETQSGIIKGKFAYMSPEQCRGRDVDRRSDVFSLGIILYEVTTQHRCFRADSDFDTMHRIVTGDVVQPTRLVLGYPPALEAIVLKALAVDPDERYASAGDLLEAMEGFAASLRMSLSMMSLGRFMRDMFGDVQEPWLMPGRLDPPPREHTISNTNASGNHAASGYPQEPPMHLPPGSTSLIDVPQGPAGGEMPSEVASWSVQPYPTAMPPQLYNPAATPPPELYDPHRMSSMSASNLSPMPPQLPGSILPGGAQPIPPFGFAAQAGSASGPAHPAFSPYGYGPPGAPADPSQSQPVYSAYAGSPTGSQPIARTRQGYSGAPGQSESSYPRYAPMPGDEPDVDIQPSGYRLLYLGGAIVVVGLLILVMVRRHNEDDPPPPGPTTQIDPGPGPGPAGPGPIVTPVPDLANPPVGEPKTNPQASPPPDARPSMLSDEIHVHVGSIPPGADVLLDGVSIGKTPLDTHHKRTTGSATLTLHHDKFQDATTTLDLSGDYTRDLTLTAVPDDPAGARLGSGKDPRPDPRPPVHGPDRPDRGDRGDRTNAGRVHAPAPPIPTPPPVTPKPGKCQKPEQMNPFDTACDGEPCPPCK
jgi:serine/threonine protein kinase